MILYCIIRNEISIIPPKRVTKTFLGRVAEWTKAPVLKTGDVKASVGSNPTSSAIGEIMKKYVEKTNIDLEVSEIKCDICGNTYSTDVGQDVFEAQEFLQISFKGGYGSIFGDGSEVECEICQHCLKEKMGEFLRVGKYNVE